MAAKARSWKKRTDFSFYQSESAKSRTRFIYEGKQERNASEKKGKNRLKAVQALKWSEPKMFQKYTLQRNSQVSTTPLLCAEQTCT